MGATQNARPLFRAYIDETGDRGLKPKSSPFFAMAAVVVRDTNDAQLRGAVDSISQVRHGHQLGRVKWDEAKHHHRLFATQRLGALPIRVVYVIVPKLTVRSGLAADHKMFYNFAARLVVERVSWLVDREGGVCKLTFEKVKGFPTTVVTDYMDLLRARRNDPNQTIEWDAISRQVRVDSPANVRNLCAADTAAGALDSALRPEPTTGLYEPTYLFNLASRVMVGRDGRVMRSGLKVLGHDTVLTNLPWWPGPFY